MKRFNIYYIENNETKVVENATLGATRSYITWLLNRGLEITGIINVEDDK